MVALALVVTLALELAAPEAPARPNLTGRWVLDKKRSEEPKGPGPRGARGAPDGGPGGRPGGGPGGRPGGGPGGGPGAGDPDVLMEDFAPAETLLITEDGADILIEAGEGRVLRLRPDGRVWKRENGVVETKAEWKGPELVAESTMRRGGKLTATYSRPSEAREILVVLKMDAPQSPLLSARRVYVASGD